MPIPIASAPTAQSPYSSIRSFQEGPSRQVPSEGAAADRRGDDEPRPREEHGRPRPSPYASTSARQPARAPSVRQEPREQDEPEHREEDRELRPDVARRGSDASARPTDQRVVRDRGARDQPERERCGRVGHGSSTRKARTRARARDRRPPPRSRVRPRDDQACEEVGGEDHGRHQCDAERLISAYAVCTSLSHQAGAARYANSETLVAARAEAGAEGRLAGFGDRARNLRELDLVAEQVGVCVRDDLPGVAAPPARDSADEERPQRTEARLVATGFGSGALTRPSSRRAPAGRSRSGCARTGTGARRGARRDARRRAARRARPGSSRAPRRASTARSAPPPRRALPSTSTPRTRRRRTPGLSSRKPTTRAVGGLAQLASEPPAGAAGSDERGRACAARRARAASRSGPTRSASRDPPRVSCRVARRPRRSPAGTGERLRLGRRSRARPERRRRRRRAIASRSRGAREPPDAAVDPERRRRRRSGRRADRQESRGRPRAATSLPCRRRRAVRDEERGADDPEVESTSTSRRGSRRERAGGKAARLVRSCASVPPGRRGSLRTGRGRRTRRARRRR